jgi:hypothetical protein
MIERRWAALFASAVLAYGATVMSARPQRCPVADLPQSLLGRPVISAAPIGFPSAGASIQRAPDPLSPLT